MNKTLITLNSVMAGIEKMFEERMGRMNNTTASVIASKTKPEQMDYAIELGVSLGLLSANAEIIKAKIAMLEEMIKS